MKPVRILAISMVAVLAISASAEAISIQGIGRLSDTDMSFAYGVSGDGKVVVGSNLSINVGGMEAIRWEGGSMVGLGHLPGTPALWGRAYGVSVDGSVIVGEDGRPSNSKAFRYEGGSMVGLPGNLFQISRAYDVSSNGSVIVGCNKGFQAGYWAGTTTAWSTLCSGCAYGVSPDGSVVVGVDYGNSHAFSWTNAGGMVELSTDTSEARDVSADGSVIVGTSDDNACRWEAGSVVNLNEPPMTGYLGSRALAVSADGAIIVGAIQCQYLLDHAFIWDATNGMQEMNLYLAGQGLDMSSWYLGAAYGISDDGLTIVGTGRHNGLSEGWIVTLDPQGPPPVIPEPLTMLCVFGGVVGLGGYVRKRRMS